MQGLGNDEDTIVASQERRRTTDIFPRGRRLALDGQSGARNAGFPSQLRHRFGFDVSVVGGTAGEYQRLAALAPECLYARLDAKPLYGIGCTICTGRMAQHQNGATARTLRVVFQVLAQPIDSICARDERDHEQRGAD